MYPLTTGGNSSGGGGGTLTGVTGTAPIVVMTPSAGVRNVAITTQLSYNATKAPYNIDSTGASDVGTSFATAFTALAEAPSARNCTSRSITTCPPYPWW